MVQELGGKLQKFPRLRQRKAGRFRGRGGWCRSDLHTYCVVGQGNEDCNG